MYWIYLALAIVCFTIIFAIFTKKEKFSLQDLKSYSKKAFGTLTDKVSKLDSKEKPRPTTSPVKFDDTTYVPAFYKIQTTFPDLTKRKPRRYDIEA